MGDELVGHTLSSAKGEPFEGANAFDSPVITKTARAALTDDAARYERKLAAEQTHARRANLTLSTALGGTAAVESLFIRDMQTQDDLDRHQPRPAATPRRGRPRQPKGQPGGAVLPVANGPDRFLRSGTTAAISHRH